MRQLHNIRGYVTLLLLCSALLILVSFFSDKTTHPRSQFATVSAAEQIWQIGNQPSSYLGDGVTGTKGEMWGTGAAFQNMQFLQSGNSGLQSNQNDIWQNLDSQVKSSETQVANSPVPPAGSTFSSDSALSNLEGFQAQDEQQPSFWSSALDSFGSWSGGLVNDARSFFFGAPDNNGCPNGVCEAIGIRG